MSAPAGPAEVRRDLAALAAGAALLFLVALGARDLWNPNEPIYGLAVREMAESGSWLVPTVHGQPFAEKPILYYVLARAASFLPGGVSEASLRLPSALAGIGSVLLVYLLVLPYGGRSRARLAAALFATTFLVWWGARSVQMDLLLAACTLAAVTAATRAVDGLRPPGPMWLLSGAACGLGVAAKGPAGIVVPGLAVLLYLVATRRLRELRLAHLALAAAGAAAFALPWPLALLAEGRTDVLQEAFWRQNVTRFLDPWDHAQPWWYYGPYLPIDFAPWSWLLPAAIALPGRDGDERRLDRLGWAWLLGTLVFFSLSASKRSPYVLPAAPAVAILASGPAARLLEHRLLGWRARWVGAVAAVAGLAAVVGALALVGGFLEKYPDLRGVGEALAALLAVGGLAILAGLARRPRVLRAGFALLALTGALYLLAAVAVLPAADAVKSAREFSERAASLAGDAPLAGYRFWRWRAEYAYYARRPVPPLQEDLASWWAQPGPRWLVVEDRWVDEARAAVPDARPALESRIGGRTVYLLGRAAASPASASAPSPAPPASAAGGP